MILWFIECEDLSFLILFLSFGSQVLAESSQGTVSCLHGGKYMWNLAEGTCLFFLNKWTSICRWTWLLIWNQSMNARGTRQLFSDPYGSVSWRTAKIPKEKFKLNCEGAGGGGCQSHVIGVIYIYLRGVSGPCLCPPTSDTCWCKCSFGTHLLGISGWREPVVEGRKQTCSESDRTHLQSQFCRQSLLLSRTVDKLLL